MEGRTIEAEMSMRNDLHTVPDGLPVPVDDGACDHSREWRCRQSN